MPEFKNPSQGGNTQDTRGFLVMIVVMFLAIAGYTWLSAKHQPPTPPENPPATTAPSSTSSTSSSAKTAAPAAVVASATPAVVAASESTTVVENELYRITFSNRGAQVTSWILKKYKDTEGKPLDLVHQAAAKKFGYPLSLYTYDKDLTKTAANALYVPSATGTLEAPATLSFNYSQGNITVKKTFSFGADYVIHADAVLTRDGAPLRALLAWPAGLGDMDTLTTYTSAQIDSSSGGKDNHDAIKKVIDGGTQSGPFDFAGTSDQYFGAIFMPDNPADATMATMHNQLMIDVKSSSAVIPSTQTFEDLPSGPTPKGKTALPFLGAAVGDLSGHDQLRLFVGPKAMNVLKSVHTADGNTLQSVLDFGFWGLIGKYLFVALQLVHTHLASNWGWAIVIFTSLIYLLLLPLRIQGMVSALKMQRIQPGIDKIKAKYGNPKATSPKMAEMNAEVMAYQKENGVSMFGGCIPSLIQLPLLFAFYTMMTRVVELRQAHWFWLHDLSQPDPYHILPILMAVTSFLVQFYTPSPGVDPQQQRMMAFMMPLFSAWFCWNYAAGLALYWNVGNLIMLGQQGIMNQTKLGLEMKAIQAERARRKAAAVTTGTRTIQARR